MIAIDTNLLIYAHRAAVPEHNAAKNAISKACNSRGGCGVATSCIAEFFSIVTHSTATGNPSTPNQAAQFITMLEEDGGLIIFNQGPRFSSRLLQTAIDLQISGVRIFDLQIALCALDNGATELWTHDHAFVKVPGLKIINPL
ncbi:MAG: PIN domain-containing protein [Deltaproteobacteria bacterium]|nr:PIN domain-containing protein [Deltaproteobacteria bacterium]